MLTSIALSAAATLVVATPKVKPPATLPLPSGQTVLHAGQQPSWRALHSDTVADLLFTTETLNGRVRFVARGLKGSTPVTTEDFTPDSVRTWVTTATELVSSAAPKMGEMRGLGQALTLNVTTATTGETAFGFYVGDAVSDQQLALALTKANVVKLTAGVASALVAVTH
ncbi:MAG: hypothetical protein ABI229_06290 [Gemmatimonadaceae bacterium]